jgi:hypothetical protein
VSQPLLTESPEKAKQRIARREPQPDPARSFQDGGNALFQLQRTLGNQRVAQLIQTKRVTPEGKIIGLQPKLTVGAADDQYEHEADRVARQVVSMPDPVAVASLVEGEANHTPTLQSKPLPLAASITPFVQRQMGREEEIERDKGKDENELLQTNFSGESAALPLQRQITTEEKEPEPVQTKSLIQRGISAEEDRDKIQTKPLTAANTFVQRQTENNEEPKDEETPIQTKFLTETYGGRLQRQSATEEEETESIQTKSGTSLSGSFDAGKDVESRLSQSKGQGSPLPDHLRSYMEPRFGADFSHVRIHTGSNAAQMNRDVSAQAFTHGSDIYYGAGSSPTNLELTAHELTHVVQQTGAAPLQTKRADETTLANINKGTGNDTSVQRICSACAAGSAPCPKCAADQEKAVQRRVGTKARLISFLPTASSPASSRESETGLISQGKIISLQRKLAIGPADDHCTHVANYVAYRMLTVPDVDGANSIHRGIYLEEDKDKSLQAKFFTTTDVRAIQRQLFTEEEPDDSQSTVQRRTKEEENKKTRIQRKEARVSAVPGRVVETMPVGTVQFSNTRSSVQRFGLSDLNPLEAAKKLADKVIGVIRSLGSSAWETAKDLGSAAWNSVKNAGSNVWDTIKEKAASISNTVTTAGSGAWNTVKGIGSSAWDGVKNLGSKAWTAVQGLGTKAWDSAKSMSGKAWDFAKQQGKNVWDGANRMGTALWDKAKGLGSSVWSTVTNKAGQAWGKVTSMGSNAWDSVKKYAGKAYDGAKIWGGKAIDGAKSIADKVTVDNLCKAVSWLTGKAYDLIAPLVKKGWDTAKEWGGKAWDAAKDLGGKLWNGAKDWGAKIGDFAKTTASKAYNTVTSGAAKAWDFAKDIGGKAINGAKQAASQAWDFAKKLGTSAWDFAKTKAGNLYNNAKQLGSKVWDKATSLGSAVWTKAQALGGQVADAARNLGNKVLGIADKLTGGAASKVAGLAQNILGKAAGLLSWVMSTAQDLVSKAINTAKEWASKALTAAKEAASKAFNAAKDAAAKAYTTAKEWGVKAVSTAKDWAGKAWSTAQDLGARAVSTAKDLAGKAWSTAKDLGAKALDTAKDWGGKAWATAKDWGGKAWDTVKGWGGKAWDFAKNWSGKAWDYAKSVGGKLLDVAKDLGLDKAWNFAKDLGTKAWNKIKEVGSAIAKRFKGVIDVAKTAGEYLGGALLLGNPAGFSLVAAGAACKMLGCAVPKLMEKGGSKQAEHITDEATDLIPYVSTVKDTCGCLTGDNMVTNQKESLALRGVRCVVAIVDIAALFTGPGSLEEQAAKGGIRAFLERLFKIGGKELAEKGEKEIAKQLARAGEKELAEAFTKMSEKELRELAELAAKAGEKELAEKLEKELGKRVEKELAEKAGLAAAEQPIKVGGKDHKLFVRQIGDKLKVFMCSDFCGELLVKCEKLLGKLTGDAARLEVEAIKKDAKILEESLATGKITKAEADAELGALGRRLDAVASREPAAVAEVLEGAAEQVAKNAFRAPAARHYIRNITQGSVTKSLNTVIEPGIDVAKDVSAINSGLAKRVGSTFEINGRVYGFHDDILFPISGSGFHQLNRGAYQALGVLNKFGDTPRAREILSKMKNVGPPEIEAALEAWRTGQ